jgi:hypothetical protein
MSHTLIDFFFAGLTVAWLIGVGSMLRAWSLARKASQHLPRPESDNYLRNLLLFPRGAWVAPLLNGHGEEYHAAAAAHVRRLHTAMVVYFTVGILGVVVSLLIRKLQ